jgi:hypothetical protein
MINLAEIRARQERLRKAEIDGTDSEYIEAKRSFEKSLEEYIKPQYARPHFDAMSEGQLHASIRQHSTEWRFSDEYIAAATGLPIERIREIVERP